MGGRGARSCVGRAAVLGAHGHGHRGRARRCGPGSALQVQVHGVTRTNCDGPAPGVLPLLAELIALMKLQVTRLRADIACFQEVRGQERPGQPRDLVALRELLAGTHLDSASLTGTKPANDAVFDMLNLVIATHLPVIEHQLRETTWSTRFATGGSPPTLPT